MAKRIQRDPEHKNTVMSYITSEMASVMDYVSGILEDEETGKSIHFSPTAMTMVRRILIGEGLILPDTLLVQSGLDKEMLAQLHVRTVCSIEDRHVAQLAVQHGLTRAEIAMDESLRLPGLKMIVIGSAPTALKKLLESRRNGFLSNIVVVATPTGFASVTQLKESLWESDIPCIVLRGKKGGPQAASVIVNALMNEILNAK